MSVLPRSLAVIREAPSVAVLLVLRATASLLPGQVAFAVARVCGLSTTLLSVRGFRTLGHMRKTFRLPFFLAFHTTWDYLARPYTDFVLFRRILDGREDISKWSIIEENADAVKKLRGSDAPFIVATAHFAREATVTLYTPWIVPGRLKALVVPLPAFSWRPSVLRTRLQFGQMLQIIRHINPGAECVYTGSELKPIALVHSLLQPGTRAIIHLDATVGPNELGSFSSPFAGHGQLAFAVGTARLARLAHCPIIPCVPRVVKHRQIELQWGEPVLPHPTKESKQDDASVTSELLGFFEVAIGERPSQYVLPIGEDRRWEPDRIRWSDAEDPKPTSGASCVPKAR